jgi:hypothetical protein
LYRSSDDGAIIVYAGDLELSKDGTTWRASGDLELRLSPRSSFVANFAGSDQWIEDCLFGERPVVALPSGADLQPPVASVLDAEPVNAPNWATLDVLVNHLGGGDIGQAERFVLHVAGTVVEYPLPNHEAEDGHQGQLLFTLPGWDLRLTATESKGATDFSVVIEAVPQVLPADAKAVGVLTGQLFDILSFVVGTETAVAAVVGLDSADQVVWAEWGAPRTGATGSQLRWCPKRLVSDAIPALAKGFTVLAADPGLEACLDRAIGLWLAANGSGVMDVRVPMACSGLDLLGWAILQHQQWLTADGLGKLSVAARTRLLMHWAGVPVELPAHFTALPARLRSFSLLGSGPEMVFEIRNRVVHPPKKLNDPEWPNSEELLEAWQLATWYLELTILRVLGYSGEYSTRLQLRGWEGATEPVPWQQGLRSSSRYAWQIIATFQG